MPKILTKLLLKQPKSESGFTLMEVLVASLMVFIFVVGSMQALALSVAIRVKAQERQRADQLIQEDIEAVRFAAENLAENVSLCRPTATNSYAKSLSTATAFPAGGNPTKRLLEDNTNSKQFILNKSVVDDSDTVLKIEYEVREVGLPTTLDPIATDYIEVIPNAATQCP